MSPNSIFKFVCLCMVLVYVFLLVFCVCLHSFFLSPFFVFRASLNIDVCLQQIYNYNASHFRCFNINISILCLFCVNGTLWHNEAILCLFYVYFANNQFPDVPLVREYYFSMLNSNMTK